MNNLFFFICLFNNDTSFIQKRSFEGLQFFFFENKSQNS